VLTPDLDCLFLAEFCKSDARSEQLWARGAIPIQNVNSWRSRFKRWLVRFRGVASPYLIHYSGWQRLLDARRLTTAAHLLRAAVQLD
jgi:hypothetical protein